MWFVIFSLLCLLLFLVSRVVTKSLSHFFLIVFKRHTPAIFALSFLFLPGVILHELSHFLMASLLFVPTGEIEFLPEVRGNEVKMGSVAIASTDPVRRFLIGVAPIIGGIGVLLLIAPYLLGSPTLWKTLLLFYTVFEIANTMFSSKKDMEGGVGLLIAVALVGVVLQILGVPLVSVAFSFSQNSALNQFFFLMSALLSGALGIDVFIVLLTKASVPLLKMHY